LEREPRLEVILLRRCEVQCARDNRHYTVWDPEALIEILRGGNHRIEHLPRLFRLGDAELFNLLKLMHAEDAPHIAPGRARLLAETCRITCVLDGELFLRVLKPLVRVECRDGLLGCGNEVLLVVARDDLCAKRRDELSRGIVQGTTYLVELFIKLIQLRGFRHDILVHHKRGLDFFVSPLA